MIARRPLSRSCFVVDILRQMVMRRTKKPDAEPKGRLQSATFITPTRLNRTRQSQATIYRKYSEA